MDAPLITLRNITKRYGTGEAAFLALKGVSFDVHQGEFLAVMGPSGSGKSTTMNMITGYLPATSGTITIDGLDVRSDLTAYRRSFGYLPEIPPLYMDMLVRDYLHFVHEAKGLPKALRAEQVRRLGCHRGS